MAASIVTCDSGFKLQKCTKKIYLQNIFIQTIEKEEIIKATKYESKNLLWVA